MGGLWDQFRYGWKVEYIREATFEAITGYNEAREWLARIARGDHNLMAGSGESMNPSVR